MQQNRVDRSQMRRPRGEADNLRQFQAHLRSSLSENNRQYQQAEERDFYIYIR